MTLSKSETPSFLQLHPSVSAGDSVKTLHFKTVSHVFEARCDAALGTELLRKKERTFDILKAVH